MRRTQKHMKIFISQSGDRSNALAHVIKDLVRLLVNEADPWISDEGIDKGARSLTVITQNLESADSGIICLTSDNLTEPWILFEAGALSRRERDRVWTVLLDIENEQVKPPLGQFQHSKASRDDLYRVVDSINKRSAKPRTDTDLKTVFEALWPTFGPRIDAIRQQAAPTGTPAKRTAEEISLEALSTSRAVLDRVERIAVRAEKTTRLVAEIYTAQFGRPAPALKELRNRLAHATDNPEDWARLLVTGNFGSGKTHNLFQEALLRALREENPVEPKQSAEGDGADKPDEPEDQ